ncbi:caspase family protein [Thalassoroseus pseudoceratinae]|uniref:caspase family protein n=1 Tax=Thalassoroseus pseudoceratinae TaxID=2713176 RepID=UPI001422CECA|nr:caspase family protein [Thalassoroseus pseudoceratinae]
MANKAFLNGINDYKHISDLRGCVNDVEELENLLTSQYGFKSNNVRTRTDRRVNKGEIKSGWKWLLRGAQAGDCLIFHFSGHGSYTVDKDGDEEGDRRDELLCLYDMDWDDEESYLLDDELWEMTQEIPDGVLLTILLDCCHSGTGTRAIMPPSTVRSAEFTPEKVPLVILQDTVERAGSAEDGIRALAVAANDPEDEDDFASQQTVLARFVAPPPEIRKRASEATVRNAFFSGEVQGERCAKELNHVLFAGCRDDQTSADAFIDGTYRGAFTHAFCESVTSHGANVEHQSLIQFLQTWMRQNRFSQVPQLEPSRTTGPIFHFGQKSSSNTGSGTSSTDRDELLIQLMQELLAQFRSGKSAGLAADRSPGRHLVYVHGICEHLANYSQPWWEAMKPHLSTPLGSTLETARSEVNWSNIVNDRSVMGSSSRNEEINSQRVAEQIKAVLQDRSDRILLEGAPPLDRHMTPEGISGAMRSRGAFDIPGMGCADDFARYLTQSQIRRRILDRFHEEIRPRLEAGVRLDIIGHSWGTVVAYEGLRELDEEFLDGRVLNFFTVGSALSIWPVKKMLAEAFRDGRKPRHVQRWINLDAQSDVVGGPLSGNPFEVDEEFLNLYPMGCEEQGFWRLKWFSPGCAHSSYFHSNNRAVNREIFARFINRDSE